MNHIQAASRAPQPLATRRSRRLAVEQQLLAGVGTMRICEQVAGEFGCTVRTVWNDIKRVQRLWQVEDRHRSAARRSAAVRRLHALAAQARAEGQLNVALGAEVAIARIEGLIVAGGGTSVQVAVGVGDGGSLRQLMERAQELEQAERIKPAQLVEAPALDAQQAAEGGKPR